MGVVVLPTPISYPTHLLLVAGWWDCWGKGRYVGGCGSPHPHLLPHPSTEVGGITVDGGAKREVRMWVGVVVLPFLTTHLLLVAGGLGSVEVLF